MSPDRGPRARAAALRNSCSIIAGEPASGSSPALDVVLGQSVSNKTRQSLSIRTRRLYRTPARRLEKNCRVAEKFTLLSHSDTPLQEQDSDRHRCSMQPGHARYP
jgi:hypothetical protein